MKRMTKLLAKYETLTPSIEIMRGYLGRARQALAGLPASDARSGLLTLADYLALQTESLGAVPQNSL
jgi:hypothetical protein